MPKIKQILKEGEAEKILDEAHKIAVAKAGRLEDVRAQPHILTRRNQVIAFQLRQRALDAMGIEDADLRRGVNDFLTKVKKLNTEATREGLSDLLGPKEGDRLHRMLLAAHQAIAEVEKRRAQEK
ncbi:hypothetical protein HY991_01265 [Candidatus Micrarchaeota archaeon]|nr:hypothetical protein [Candidatus Micrarchaeota archaeon]